MATTIPIILMLCALMMTHTRSTTLNTRWSTLCSKDQKTTADVAPISPRYGKVLAPESGRLVSHSKGNGSSAETAKRVVRVALQLRRGGEKGQEARSLLKLGWVIRSARKKLGIERKTLARGMRMRVITLAWLEQGILQPHEITSSLLRKIRRALPSKSTQLNTILNQLKRGR